MVDEYYGPDLFIAEWDGQEIDRASSRPKRWRCWG